MREGRVSTSSGFAGFFFSFVFSFSPFKFLPYISVHISRSNDPVSLICISLKRSFPPAKLEFKMMPILVKGGGIRAGFFKPRLREPKVSENFDFNFVTFR